MRGKARIAHLAGPNATIQNTPPLVTSNKARVKHRLPLLTNPDGTPARFDVLRPQRLAAPVTLYVEQFSAHPLEADAAELYGAPDGYIDGDGRVHKRRQSLGDKPVYEVELSPEDGLYPLPYMAMQADGEAWGEECAFPGAPEAKARQGFFPDGSRSFEEIDRLQIGEKGTGNLISANAEVDFYRLLPPSGYTKGLPADRRTDSGAGDIPPERRGVDFFPYKPAHLSASVPRSGLARATNAVQQILESGKYDGAIWTEGSPRIEETIYWLNLLIDTTLPICGNAAQRPQGMISNDGPKNIVDSVEYIASRVWEDEQGRNRAGAVLIQEQRVFAARAVQKADARPGGYVATGGHGGILGASGHDGAPLLHYLPTARHTWKSEVNVSRLPPKVAGVRQEGSRIETVSVAIKGPDGKLLDGAIPKVAISKDASYWDDDGTVDPEAEVDLVALIGHLLKNAPLAGFVVEGFTPYGRPASSARHRLMLRAVYSGLPVVRVGRGNTEGFVPLHDPDFIGGSNLTATKARLLLMACLMKFGSLPPAADPDHPTSAESAAVREKVAAYQAVFDTH
ncbi:MAG TPA: asparaginase domain-containing protein [Stellaceae bacterium]|nr:asparaginase domain-containing protein [Stellaceae bacterium]